MNTPDVYRIVLTGGPCGGKTTALSHICERLRSAGFDVYTVPEAATILLGNGALPGTIEDQIITWESNMMILQQHLENRFINIAKSTGKKSVVICDRGMMDGSAFVTPHQWAAILDENHWTVVDLRDRRYDAVIHIMTAAEGAEKHYNTLNNPVRTETPGQARLIDQKLRAAWLGQPHLRVIDNSTNFEGKIKRVLAAVCGVVGIPEPRERERKFLLRRMPTLDTIPVPFEVVDIEQYYLCAEDKSTARVRRRGQRGSYTYTHTIKHKIRKGEHAEFERPISSREFIRMLEKRDPECEPVIKRRYCFLWDNYYYELDEFISPRAGLVLLEIEDGDDIITLPPFLDIECEVTGVKGYTNRQIASGRHPNLQE
jgi:CYTH domain-containing protein/predicted ATPase